MLSGISRMFLVSFCVYDTLIVPWKCPGVSGFNSNVIFCIPLPGIFWRSSVLMKSRLEVAFSSVRFSFPKLKSSIVSFDFVSVNISARRRSGFCRRSGSMAGEINVVFCSGDR